MVGKKIIWAREASEDLYNILDFYIKRNGNSDYSKKIKSRIDHTVSLLGIHEKLGRKTDITNIRFIIELDYLVFYEILDDCIQVLFVWDTHQNPELLKNKLEKI